MTEARLTFGARGRALDTAAALRFALDHARAREAVLAELDVEPR
jgi:ethanolamine ammonia-lyase small subunit